MLQGERQRIAKSCINIQFASFSLQTDRLMQNQGCNAISFNIDNSIMIAGCDTKIKVYQFQNGKLKEIQIINEHLGNVYVLEFMKKSDEFVSGCVYGKIQLWGKLNSSDYSLLQKFQQSHQGYIWCILINSKEDLLISCSEDFKIKFWKKESKWKCNQTLVKHKSFANSLSLNNSETQLVSCGYDKLILIIQVSLDQMWCIQQRIQVEQFGRKVCFIDEYSFIFQPYSEQQMEVYQIKQQSKIYMKIIDVKLENTGGDCELFPSKFNQTNKLLLHRFGQVIYLIRVKEQTVFEIVQKIHFQHQHVFGTVTHDWQYLVTWNRNNYWLEVLQQKD